MCVVHDTLESDDGQADECVWCGQTFARPQPRPVYTSWSSSPTSSQVRPHLLKSRGVEYRSINGLTSARR